jgi:hypothetical protein
MVAVEAVVRVEDVALLAEVVEQEGLDRTIRVEIHRVAAVRVLTQVCLDHL